jgi:hypothetical protein
LIINLSISDPTSSDSLVLRGAQDELEEGEDDYEDEEDEDPLSNDVNGQRITGVTKRKRRRKGKGKHSKPHDAKDGLSQANADLSKAKATELKAKQQAKATKDVLPLSSDEFKAAAVQDLTVRRAMSNQEDTGEYKDTIVL